MQKSLFSVSLILCSALLVSQGTDKSEKPFFKSMFYVLPAEFQAYATLDNKKHGVFEVVVFGGRNTCNFERDKMRLVDEENYLKVFDVLDALKRAVMQTSKAGASESQKSAMLEKDSPKE